MWLSLLSVAFGAPTHASINAASWKQISTRTTDGGTVTVYETSIDGVACFRGEMVTTVAPQVLLSVAIDIPTCTRWSTAGVRDSEVLAKGADWVEYYQYLDVPGWTMASDRFWFLRLTAVSSPERSTVQWDRMGERGGPHNLKFDAVLAANSSAVEPSLNIGGWTFAKTPAGTRVDYRVCTNPGGSIPVVVQNAATKQTLPETVADVVREAKRRSAP